MTTTFVPVYSRWRHGGWYVNNVRYPSGAVGCVSRNYPDKKWRIVCDDREGDHTYPSRDAAALAESELATIANARWRACSNGAHFYAIRGPAGHTEVYSDASGRYVQFRSLKTARMRAAELNQQS